MTRRLMQYRVCDRCPGHVEAQVVERISYDGQVVQLDLCHKHSAELSALLEAWMDAGTRIGESSRFDQRKVVNGPVVLDLARPTPAAAPDSEPSKGPAINLHPAARHDYQLTEAGRRSLDALSDVTWPEVVAELNDSTSVIPSGRDGVDNVLTRRFSVLVATDRAVLGVVLRDVEPVKQVSLVKPPRLVRKGKRGGVGNLKPKTTEQILAALDAAGWTYVKAGNGHWRACGPDGQSCQISATASDWRTAMNDFARLRRAGLQVAV